MNALMVESSNGGEAEQKCMGLAACCCQQRSSSPPPPNKPRIADRSISSYLWKTSTASHQEEQAGEQQRNMTTAIQTNDKLKQVLRQAKQQPNSKLVVLEFMATWSEPCKYMRPAVAEIAARFKDHAEFYTLDVDKFKTFARNTRVEALPTFLLVRSTILERVVGVSKDDLHRSIDKHITSITVHHEDRTNGVLL